jgi:hypothetical protein
LKNVALGGAGDRFTAQDVLKETGEDLGAIHQRFIRLANLRIGLIKRYDEPVKTALQRLPRISGTGLTPLGEAMQVGARRIIVRPELRRSGRSSTVTSPAAGDRRAHHK